jgi:hypothetical protein
MKNICPNCGAEKGHVLGCRFGYLPNPGECNRPAMVFNPVNGLRFIDERHFASLWRYSWPHRDWLYNPWTGKTRTIDDVLLDPMGILITTPEAPAPVKEITPPKAYVFPNMPHRAMTGARVTWEQMRAYAVKFHEANTPKE